MDDVIERDARAVPTVTVPDRRRAGRIAYKNPFLIALLRNPSPSRADDAHAAAPTAVDAVDYESDIEADSLGPARCIAISVVLGTLAWIGIAAALWRLFAS